MFTQLRTKLTVLYAALFGVILILVSIAVYSVAVNVAERQVKGELASAGTVFDRIWTLRASELKDSAGVTSRDFGFRSAVATHDEATIASALDNLKQRLNIDQAFMIGLDGRIMGGDTVVRTGAGAKMFQALNADEDASGVFMMDGAPYQIVTAPIQAPTTVGWVVFASRLDQTEMTALERLSAIPLSARVLARGGDGGWMSGGAEKAADGAAITGFIKQALKDKAAPPRRLATEGGGLHRGRQTSARHGSSASRCPPAALPAGAWPSRPIGFCSTCSPWWASSASRFCRWAAGCWRAA